MPAEWLIGKLTAANEATQAVLALCVAAGVTWRWTYPNIIRPTGAWFFGMAMLPTHVAVVKKLATETASSVERMNREVFNGGANGLVHAMHRVNARQRVMTRDEAWWEAAESGRNIGVTPGFTALLGWTEDDMRGDGWLRMVHPSEREAYTDAWLAAVDERTSFRYPRVGGVKFLKADGEIIDVVVTAAPTGGEINGDIVWYGVVEPYIKPVHK